MQTFCKHYNNIIQILLYNYHHYSEMHARNITINTSYAERYSDFPSAGRKRFAIQLENVDTGYLCHHTVLNRSHGSIFNAALRMGLKHITCEMDMAYLTNAVQPLVQYEQLEAVDKGMLNVVLEPFEVRLIYLRKNHEKAYIYKDRF